MADLSRDHLIKSLLDHVPRDPEVLALLAKRARMPSTLIPLGVKIEIPDDSNTVRILVNAAARRTPRNAIADYALELSQAELLEMFPRLIHRQPLSAPSTFGESVGRSAGA